MPLPPIPVFQPYGQRIILLLAALKDAGVSLSRQEAVQHISEKGWFALQAEDRQPYPSQTQGSSHEARWKTWIAWGRKDAVLLGFVNDFERDAWSLTRKGHECWDHWRLNFESGAWEVSKGFLWSQKFKRMLCPAYEPTSQDAIRPPHLYRDVFNAQAYIAELEKYIGNFK